MILARIAVGYMIKLKKSNFPVLMVFFLYLAQSFAFMYLFILLSFSIFSITALSHSSFTNIKEFIYQSKKQSTKVLWEFL